MSALAGVTALPRRRHERTPTILQMEAVECGAAALGIVLAHYGRWVPLEELRIACGVSRDGSRAANLVRAARKYGLDAKGYQMDIPALRQLRTPFLVFWDFRHFLVVEGFHGDTVHLNDPAAGPRKVKLADFDRSYTGVVITLDPTDDFERGGVKPSLARRLAPRLAGVRIGLLLAFAAGLLLVVPGLITPVFTRIFIDKVLYGGYTGWTLPLVLAMAGAAAATAILTTLQLQYLLRVESKMSLVSTGRFLRHVLRLPVDFFIQRQPADVASRVTSNDTIAQLLSRDFATSAIGAVFVVFYVGLMFSYDVVLTLIGIGMVLLNIVALRLAARARTDATAKLQQDKGRLVAATYNGLQLIETLKATGTENDFFARWAGFQVKVANGQQRLGVPTQLLAVVPPFLAAVNTALILLVGSKRAIDGAITVGILVAFQGLIAAFTKPVQQLTMLGQKLQNVVADVNRVGDVDSHPTAPVFAAPIPDDEAEEEARLEGYLELKDVTFGYTPLSAPLLEHFSFSVEPGHRVALVGGSGSGKSTIARLIAGLYQPWEGAVLLDGRPRDTISRYVLAGSLAVVDQDIFLFEGTVRENLTLWDDSVPDEVLFQALRDASLFEDIMSRPGGLNGHVADGGRNLSGGQRQRLEIARALAVNPRVLVLDEATSALDPQTEKLIDDGLRRRGCTCVVVAHRLSTIRDADEIIVLEYGKVVQRGTHDELKDREGAYAELIGAEA